MDKKEKIEKFFEECIKELNSIGIIFKDKEINIIISKRNNKRYGCCRPEMPDEEHKVMEKKRI